MILKGRMAEKLKKEKKEKMQKTLRKMELTRIADAQLLRKTIDEKLIWATEQIKNGEKALTNLERQKTDLIDKMVKLQGASLVLRELKNLKVEPKKEPKKEDKE